VDLILLEELTRRFGSLLALETGKVRLPPGAIGLLGPNGAGKSTLIKLLLGLLPPSSGRAEVLGLDPRRQGRQVRELVGYVPENDSFPPGLSGLDTVGLAGELAGMGRREALRRAHEVLNFLGVDEERYRPVEEQSTGQRQRIKFAQALVHDPQLLVLDEPTNGLDPAGRRSVLDLVRSLHRDFGKSIIFSSHLLEDVDRVCDFLIILSSGKVLAHGRTDELRLDLRRRYRLSLRGRVEPVLARLASEGVVTVGEPRIAGDGWEGLLEAPEGWKSRSLFQLLDSAGDGGAVLRALVPERERLIDLFQRVTAGSAAGADGAGGADGD
jgi:ABC-2 type transport system ATP-binding protein